MKAESRKNENDPALRIAEAKTHSFFILQEQLFNTRQQQGISYCIHTDFTALRKSINQAKQKSGD